jgi:type VI secretion system protein VasG
MTTTSKSEDFRTLLARFDPVCLRSFQGATSLCQSRTHFEVLPEHLLLRMFDEPYGDVTRILDTFKVDRGQIRRALLRILEELPVGHRGKPALSPKVVELFQAAAALADRFGLPTIRPGAVLAAFALNPSHTRVGEFTPELERIDADQLQDHFQEIVQSPAESPTPGAPGAAGPAMAAEGSALAQFTVDLTAKARAGEIDPVFGRDQEIRQVINIFARRRKNNPILVGEPGTGKTAIVEGLALRIVEGDVPPSLEGVKLLALDIGLLQAGASVKGEFENRLKNVIREIKDSKEPVVSFIDEAHTLIGAGGPAGGSDAANLLKPALARGELRTVAATTWAEYKKYFEKDAALERRFQLVRCDEPDIENATVMLRGLKDKYEKHHKVVILDEAVTAAVKLSSRFISGRFLPDKAVDLLDTAAARVAVGLSTPPASLEDIDRKLGHLLVAIQALQRDRLNGVATEETVLTEMEDARKTLLLERESVDARWRSERDAVNRIVELRAELQALQPVDGRARSAGRPADAPDGTVPAPAVVEKPPADAAGRQTVLRAELEKAIPALAGIQGDSPLLHPHVDASAVAAIVSDWTGIPAGKMVRDEIAGTLRMEERLRERVVGQDHAIAVIAEKLRIGKAGLRNPAQPLGVFLCVGPSGVGKTELALAVADLLFGGERFLTAINMSEFMEAHTVSQLKGSPPGYVGYGEGGVLTEAVRQHPYSVVLLDEVEKAHPDVMNLFYQVFDKGVLADGEGRIVDFKNTVLFMTSNLGSEVILGMCESGEAVDWEELREAIYPHLRGHFKPALVARTTVVPFCTLGKEVLKSIARMKIAKVAGRLTEAHRMCLNVGEAVYEEIARRCDQVDAGARQIDHLLDQKILPQLSRDLLQRIAEGTLPDQVAMGMGANGEFQFTFSEADA